MRKTIIISLATAFSCLISKAQLVEGTLDNIKIASPSIQGNLFNDNSEQDVAVYLPPSYTNKTEKKYPVLYFLCGYYDKVNYWTETGHFQGFRLKENMDKLMNEGAIKEMIVVIPNSFTFLEGSFFTNSQVNGNYENFYTQELINYIDDNYRTINNRDARAIAGHSMGGSGALDLSMKYPDIFCMGYGLCSGLLAPNWVEESPIFGREDNIRESITLFNLLDTLPRNEAHNRYVEHINELRPEDFGWLTIFGYAYGTAFASDTSINAPYFNYPFSINNDELLTDSTILADWEDGFGDLPNKIKTYKENLLNLKAYVLDYGKSDFWKYIVSGNEYYHELLTEAGIPHSFIENGGDHESKVKQQIETSILPLCNNTLVFDTVNLNTDATIINVDVQYMVGNAEIDNTNKKINIVVNNDAFLTRIKPQITTSVGASIEPKSRMMMDFSDGSITYTITSEDGLNSESWEINVTQQTTSTTPKIDTKSFLYPNPVKNVLYLPNEITNRIDKIDIYDNHGNLAYTSQGPLTEVNTSGFTNGLYFINITLDSGMVRTNNFLKK